MITRDKQTGKFKKILPIWQESTWDAGWYDNKGRFRVYRPDYPRAFSGGYALRAWVVYWLRTGNVHPVGTNLHHINHIKDDDRFENLQVIEHGEHSRIHHIIGDIKLVCEHCEQSFQITKKKFNARIKEGNPIRFCSQKCYHSHPKSEESRKKQGESLKRAYQEGRKATPKGRKHSIETKQKMSETHKGKKMSEQTRENMRKAWERRKAK